MLILAFSEQPERALSIAAGRIFNAASFFIVLTQSVSVCVWSQFHEIWLKCNMNKNDQYLNTTA